MKNNLISTLRVAFLVPLIYILAPGPLPAQDRFAGVWASSEEEHYLWVGADWEHFEAKWQEWSDQGRRLISLETYLVDGKRRYAGIWEPGNDGHYLWVGADWDNFKAKWEELSAQNLRLVDLETYTVGRQRRYAGVWRSGNDGHFLWVGADWKKFKAKWEELSARNLRLVDLETYIVDGERRYAGVWRSGSDKHYLWVGVDWDNFYAKWQELSAQNLRLIDLETYTVGGERRYAGVWRSGSYGHYLWVGVDWDSFKAKRQELAEDGLRLVDLVAYTCGNRSHEAIMGGCPSVCTNNDMIIGCDGRRRGPTNTEGATEEPWRQIGRLSMGCTGTLIGPRHVLTAAHCLLNSDNELRVNQLHFRLGQFNTGPASHPYGTRYAYRVFVPVAYDNTSISEENKALDYAVVELVNPILEVAPMDFGYQSWETLEHRTPYSIGYPYDKTTGTSWSTGPCNIFLDNPFRWIEGGERGLLHVTNDGAGGQSGSPVYISNDGERKVIGVLIGSPVSSCEEGVLWASRLTPEAVERVENSMLYPPNGTVLDLSWRVIYVPNVPGDVEP